MSKIPENILQAGCTAYADTFLNGNGSLVEGIEAAYFAIHEHDEWVRASPPAWSGEGLPPVGMLCEVDYCEGWHRCEVIAHFQQRCGMVAAFTIKGNDGAKSLDAFGEDYFRPIRTPEQIAADERLAAISYMEIDAGMCATAFDGDPEARVWIENLIDKGWRKQGGAMTINAPTFPQLITSLAQAGYSFEHISRSPFRAGWVWTVEVMK